ncbi:ABC transporter permease [Candidatus Peregrinibacteria bacterium]|nr:ABC transporter permease [Candidatus Peregrinibacteria bacterium]
MKQHTLSFGVTFIGFIAWELIVRGFNVPEYLVPAPTVIASRFVETFPTVMPHFLTTGLEALIGFMAAAIFGFGFAVLFITWTPLEHALYPYAIALKSVPIVAIAPLLIIWFGNGLSPKIIVAALISFFPILVNAVRGLTEIDREHLDIFDSLAATRYQVLRKLRIPSSLPYLFSGLRIAATLAVIGAIVGEFAGADSGLGYFITISSHRLETVDMFVGIFLSSLLGIGAFYGIVLVERLLIAWHRQCLTD